MQKERKINLDLLKTIAIFCVILAHIVYLAEESIFHTILIILTGFGVPIFFMVNGILLLNKEFDLKKHIKKTINIIFLFIFWSILTLLSVILLGNNPLTIQNFIKIIFSCAMGEGNIGHLWFLQELIKLYLIFPIIKVVKDKNDAVYNYFVKLLIIATMGIGILTFTIQILAPFLPEVELWNDGIGWINKLNPIGILSYATPLLYFCLGGELEKHKDKFKNIKSKIISIIIFLIIMMIIIMSFKQYGNQLTNISMPILLTTLYIITLGYEGKIRIIRTIVNKIGENTLGIYLLHWIVIKVMLTFNMINGERNSVIVLIGLVILFICLSISSVLRKIKYIKKIVQ